MVSAYPVRVAALALAVSLAISPTQALASGEDTARLRFDLAGARLEVEVAGELYAFELHPVELDGEDVGARVSGFHRSLEQGAWEADEASALGDVLLGPARALLESRRTWEVSPVEVAPLDAMIPPWGHEEPLVESVAVSYRPAGVPWPPRPIASGSIPADPPASSNDGEGMLVVAPYHAGFDPMVDNPDTVLRALRPELRTLHLVPRNDTTPASIAGSLLDHSYAVVWLRARPADARPLLPPLSGGPALLWWSRPGNESLDPDRGPVVLEIASMWALGGKSILVDLWPREERRVAEGIRAFVRQLQAGSTAIEALALARRELRAGNPAAPQAWAGWILVGPDPATVRLKKATWLQKLFRR